MRYSTADRTARCPVCIAPGPGPGLGEFAGADDEELFAKIADHVMAVHGGGPGDAFDAAERALPHVGRIWRDRLGVDAWA